MANKKIIELDAASQINSDALFVTSQLVSGDQKTLKATVAQMQAAMLAPVSGLVTLGESSGSIASFNTDISDKLFSCYVNVVATQAGSGTPAPDNVRAISGWSACNLSASGNNIWDEKIKANYTIDGTTGQDMPVSGVWCTDSYIALAPNTNYYLKSTQYVNARWYDANKAYLGYSVLSANTIFNSTTAYPNARYLRFNGYGSSYANDISINYPSTDTAYHKYNGTTHNIPFNTTVYGGVLDVLSGVLTVTHTLYNLGDYTWVNEGNGVARIDGAQYDLKFQGSVICSIYNGGSTQDGGIYVVNAQSYPLIRIKDTTRITSETTAEQIKTLVTGGQAAFELYEPTTIQLTPTQVKTILGQNNIFADCGDIDLKYLETIGNRL